MGDQVQSYTSVYFLKTLCTRPEGLSVSTLASDANISGVTFKIEEYVG